MNTMIGSDAGCVRVRGRTPRGWMDGVKRALIEKGIFVDQRRMIVHDRSEWRAIVTLKKKHKKNK